MPERTALASVEWAGSRAVIRDLICPAGDGAGTGWRRELTMRRTDVFVRDKLRLVPLSVSADRIAHVALRCAVLLAKLDASGRPVDRTGAGAVVEVYPAAS